LVILWERPDRLLSHSTLMILLYPNPDTAPLTKSLEINLCRLRKAILGTPYSIINRRGEGFIFTAKPPNAHEIARRAKRAVISDLARLPR
jgi:hypothetical protein